MEYIFVTFLLVIPYSNSETSPYTRSACYGCFLHLDCMGTTIIHILSAQYLFTNKKECKDQQHLTCEKRKNLSCCNADNAYQRRNFTEEDAESLRKTCSSKSSCNEYQAPWTQENHSFSSLIKVKYSCKSEHDQNVPEDNTQPSPGPSSESLQDSDNTAVTVVPQNEPEDNTQPGPGPSPKSLQDSDNTAVTVVPIVMTLLAVIIVAVIFIYWKRKKQRQTDKPANTGNGVLQRAVQNEGYMKTEAPNELDTEHLENTYHTIDLNSLPGETADDPGPQDDYHMIDPNKLDYETPGNHDYFILEPETGGTNEIHNEVETEYNRINLDSNEVVNDPSYHRLGSLENGSGDKHVETHDNYSHIENGHQGQGNKARTIDEQAKQQQEILDDDYSHLNN